MTLSFWCVLIAGILPYLAVLPAKGDKSIDNRNPRDGHALQSGRPKRAYAAHLNGLEAFPFFAAAVIIAHQLLGPNTLVNALAAFFIVVRVAYVLAYWTDRATIRSILWAIGFVTVLAIFSFTAVMA